MRHPKKAKGVTPEATTGEIIPPRRPTKSRPIEEIIEMGAQALNAEIERLAGESELSTWQGKQLCEYIAAAVSIEKNGRDRQTAKLLGRFTDEQLDEMLLKQAPELAKLIREKRPDLLLGPVVAP